MTIDISVPLQGKVALITGSTSGMGQATALLLAKNGASIALHGFATSSEVAAMGQQLSSLGIESAYFAHDLSDATQAAALVPDVIARFGQIDILINNAGVQHVAAVDVFPDDAWNRVMAINLTAAFMAIRAVWPGMKARGWGRIINTASTLAMTAEINKSAYVATKHGLLGLTREIALEGARCGITCNAVCPGWVLTPLVRQQVEAKAKLLNKSFEDCARDEFVRDLPSGRFVEIEEIAAAMLFLCSDAARSITGIALPVDGASLVI